MAHHLNSIADPFHRMSVEIRIMTGFMMRTTVRALDEHLERNHAPITHLQYGILRTLTHQPFTLSELSRKFALDPSTLVPVVDSLVKKGFVERGHDPNDRRRSPLAVTEAGQAVMTCVRELPEDDLMVQAMRTMGEAKSRQLLEGLREIIAHMPEGAAMLAEIGISPEDAKTGSEKSGAKTVALDIKPVDT